MSDDEAEWVETDDSLRWLDLESIQYHGGGVMGRRRAAGSHVEEAEPKDSRPRAVAERDELNEDWCRATGASAGYKDRAEQAESLAASLAEALEKIASCETFAPGDCSDIARTALARYHGEVPEDG